MDFQPFNISNFPTIYGIIFPATKMWITVCFSAGDNIKISYHYEILLVGKFLSLLTIELTVPSSGRYFYYFQSEWEVNFHTLGLHILWVFFIPRKGIFYLCCNCLLTSHSQPTLNTSHNHLQQHHHPPSHLTTTPSHLTTTFPLHQHPPPFPCPILTPARATNNGGQWTLSMWAQMMQLSFGP